MIHEMVIGQSGTGKSESKISRIANGHRYVVVDPQESALAWRVMNYCCGRRDVVFDRLRRVDRVIPWGILKRSKKIGYEAEIEDEEALRAFAEILIHSRGMTTLARTPLIEEWLVAVLKLGMKQMNELPVHLWQHALNPRHPVHAHMVQNTEDEAIQWKFESLRSFSPTALRNEVSPAERILTRAFDSPSFKLRTGSGFDFVSHLNRGGNILIEGGGIAEDAKKDTLGMVIQRVMQEARRGSFTDVVTLVIDEASTVCGAYEAKGLCEMRKFNLRMIFLSQSLSFEPEMVEAILQNCDTIEVFRCNSIATARLCAGILGTANLDPDMIHHYSESRRQFKDPTHPEDHSKIIDTYEYQPHFAHLSDQIRMQEKELLTLDVGQCVRRTKEGIKKVGYKLLEEPYPWGLTEKKTEEAIAKSIGEYGIVPSLSSWESIVRQQPIRLKRKTTSAATLPLTEDFRPSKRRRG